MIELLTTAEMAQADRLTIAGGMASIELMENAGRAVADQIASQHAIPARVVVVAGPGNNGGDGFVAARHLAERGHAVRVILIGNANRLRGDAAVATQRYHGRLEAFGPEALREADIIVDALFGAGLDRAVSGEARSAIEAMNAATAATYAVDLPSGVNGTSGAVMGVAVDATETITFFRRKPGHLLLPGRLHCGRVKVAEIGIAASVLAEINPTAFANGPALWSKDFPVPQVAAHKYSRGHAVVVSGEMSSTGAARLAARGALRAGAGLVTLATPRGALAVNAAASLAVMVRAVDGAEELSEFLSDQRRNAVVLGPGGGLGAPMQALVRSALSRPCGVVLDADALTSFADVPRALIAAISSRPTGDTVLTPHDGEFARLFRTIEEIPGAGSRLERARAAARATGAIILLKGPDTVVAAPDGRAAIAENAPPWLATAGAGDVLAGFVAGLLAQGMAGFEAAAAAVWLHGECGTEAGPGLIAEDLPEMMPLVYRRLFVDLAVRL
jgi:hydroxyethylthiazole kinase-like uncharacterized protein yjeF